MVSYNTNFHLFVVPNKGWTTGGLDWVMVVSFVKRVGSGDNQSVNKVVWIGPLTICFLPVLKWNKIVKKIKLLLYINYW